MASFFHIISKDSGLDPLLANLIQRKFAMVSDEKVTYPDPVKSRS